MRESYASDPPTAEEIRRRRAAREIQKRDGLLDADERRLDFYVGRYVLQPDGTWEWRR